MVLLILLLGWTWACGSADPEQGPGEDQHASGDEHDSDEHDSDEHDHGPDADHDHGSEGDHDHGPGADHDHGPSADLDHESKSDHDPGSESEHDHGPGGHSHGTDDDNSWAVTAFGERFEIFAETEPLVVDTPARAHTHVTVLADFSALSAGRVEVVLAAPGLDEQVFTATSPVRDGIFDVSITPPQTGTFGLRFRIETPSGTETIDAGTVRVGSADEPGGLIAAAFDRRSSDRGDGEPTPFTKEQQWQTDFATAWVRAGALADSVRGPATVRPPAGGEAVLTAPVDGVLQAAAPSTWPHAGRSVRKGETLFSIVPRDTDGAPVANLEAEVTRATAELEPRRGRLARLEKLLAVEAVSRREVEELRAEVTSREADLTAARQNLANEQSARRGGAGDATGQVAVEAPFAAQVANVDVSPGETVSAGATLARLVVRAPLWIDIRLPPAAASQLDAAPSGLLLRISDGTVIEVTRDDVELVARHPEVDAATGTVGVVLALREPPPALIPGLRVEAEVLLPTAREGIVIPRDALVDDSGIDVVYLQRDGESFARREVNILARQGERVLVSGLRAGERLVKRGGPAIRRAALVASGGTGHGHVH